MISANLSDLSFVHRQTGRKIFRGEQIPYGLSCYPNTALFARAQLGTFSLVLRMMRDNKRIKSVGKEKEKDRIEIPISTASSALSNILSEKSW